MPPERLENQAGKAVAEQRVPIYSGRRAIFRPFWLALAEDHVFACGLNSVRPIGCTIWAEPKAAITFLCRYS
jgi:hypothetical protein